MQEGLTDAASGAGDVADAELLALKQRRVEVAERKDDGTVLCLLGARLEHLLVELAVGATEVGLEALRGLVGQLDAVLQEGDGQALLEGGRGLGGEEEAEVGVGALGQLVNLLLQGARGKVDLCA